MAGLAERYVAQYVLGVLAWVELPLVALPRKPAGVQPMTFMRSARSIISIILSAIFMLTTVSSALAQSSMIGTSEVIAEQQVSVDRQSLTHMLGDQAVQDKLASMGVSPEQVEQRINSLTPSELASFNAQLSEAPTGAGAVGIIVLFLLVFILTDALCVTNIFNFVHCAR